MKLYLLVSQDVPELPRQAARELAVERIESFAAIAEDRKTLRAFLLSPGFVRENRREIRRHNLPKGCILLWNPDRSADPFRALPEELFYGEVVSFADPRAFLRSLRNLYRALALERELERREEALRSKDKEIRQLLEVGIALSAERDTDKLLALILRRIREFTAADAGSLYLLQGEELAFKIAQNDSNPTDFTEFSMPLSKKSLAGYVAITGEILNLKDVYSIPPDREYSFNKSYDLKTGYRTKSVLTVPMKDHQDQIIGALQLINRKRDPAERLATAEKVEKRALAFSREHESLVLSLASQAAVTLENNMLYREIEHLFEGFVRASVKAIEARDPATSGHSNRVAVYTVSLAEAVDRAASGAYAGCHFTPDQIKEIRYASLLHDFGKVGVRERVLVKAKKLYPEQLELVKSRFAYMLKLLELEDARERFELLRREGPAGYEARRGELDARLAERLEEMRRYLAAVIETNEPSVLGRESSRLIDAIVRRLYRDPSGRELPLLSEDEYVKLSVERGNLDDSERREIESHVTHTYLFLKTIPWTRSMQRIPEIAYGHHEKLDGAGYPLGLATKNIPVQARMMAIADMFDALTAMDRPYKPAVSETEALLIMEEEARENRLDSELLRIFREAGIWTKRRELIESSRA